MAFILTGGGDARGASFREIYGSVHPSVVVIDTTQRKLASGSGRQMVDRKGLGSGVLISDDGKIITASHVVQIADEVRVRFKSGETVEATVIASEPAADISLLQLRSVPKGARVVPIAKKVLRQ
jgi:S1-C subfamily serine protease